MKLRTILFDDGMRARALRGSAMTGISVAGQHGLRLAGNLILTRLLFPEAFGLMALVQVVMVAAGMFSDLGLRGSIIQDARGNDPAFLNTAWTLQICRGFVLSIAVYLLSDPLAEFYGAPLLADILKLSALVPAIQGFNSTRIGTANRRVSLGRLTALMLGTQIVGILSMILLAWWLRSVWALALGTLVSAATLAVLSHIVLPGVRNRLHIEVAALRRLLGFGKYIFFATLAGFFLSHGDRAVLGRFIPIGELAIYNIGIFLATAPLLLSNAVNNQVIFPLYARRPPTASASNRQQINRARFYMSGGLVAATGLLALVGPPLVRVLYDPRYEAAGAIVTLGALAALPRLVTLSYEKMPLAMGHSGRYALFVSIRAALQLSLLIYGVQAFGLVGAIVAPVLAWGLSYPLQAHLVGRYRGWDPRHDALFLGLCTAIAGLVLWLQADALAPVLAPILAPVLAIR